MNKCCLFAITLSLMAWAWAGASQAQSQQPTNRFHGYIFSVAGHDYITERLATTAPQYRIIWSADQPLDSICKSRRPGKCPSYEIQFTPQTALSGNAVFTNVTVVDPLDDPKARLKYLRGPVVPPHEKQ
jgi:hypothetical protein